MSMTQIVVGAAFIFGACNGCRLESGRSGPIANAPPGLDKLAAEAKAVKIVNESEYWNSIAHSDKEELLDLVGRVPAAQFNTNATLMVYEVGVAFNYPVAVVFKTDAFDIFATRMRNGHWDVVGILRTVRDPPIHFGIDPETE